MEIDSENVAQPLKAPKAKAAAKGGAAGGKTIEETYQKLSQVCAGCEWRGINRLLVEQTGCMQHPGAGAAGAGRPLPALPPAIPARTPTHLRRPALLCPT